MTVTLIVVNGSMVIDIPDDATYNKGSILNWYDETYHIDGKLSEGTYIAHKIY